MSDRRDTYPAPRHDPVTGEPLLITRLEGPTTGIAIEGRFTFGGGGRLNTLSPEHLAFVEVFIKNRGIIKDVEAELGISYPTVRARLDEVIRAMGYAPYPGLPASPVAPAVTMDEAQNGVPSAAAAGSVPGSDDERRALLADVAAGRIPASEAARFIRRQERDARRAERSDRKGRNDA